MRRTLLLAMLALLVAPAAAGAITTRIIGGQVAVPGDWPSTVAIETSYGSQFCGGSLVAPQWVLTAGHCKLYPTGAIRVVAGTATLSAGSGEVLPVARQVRHPSYRQIVPGAPRNDLLLLRLQTASVQPPIALAPGTTAPPTGTLLRVAGWGSTRYNPVDDSFGPESDVLRAVGVRVKSADQCIEAYGANAFHVADMVCASLPGRDACAGDSGGPLVDQPGPAAVLVGVVSWGTGCAMPRYPGVYSLVARNRCWIASMITAPPTPPAITVTEQSGALTVDWEAAKPCADAAGPSAFAVTVVETGQTVQVAGGEREATLPGLVDGTPYTVSVTAINENGSSAPTSIVGTPGPNPILADRAAWSGYRTADVAFTLAPHVGDVRWRLEAGVGLRYRARDWQTAPADAAPQVVRGTLDGLPVGKAVDVRVVVDDGTRTTSSARAQLVQPIAPTPIGGVHIRGLARAGRAIFCDLGRWNGTRPFAVTRQWLQDGRAIAGATRQALRVSAPQVGRTLACRLEVAGPGGIARRTTPGVDVTG
ncbi:MAG: trypsin-like serine protease [Gaiellales bacterium]